MYDGLFVLGGLFLLVFVIGVPYLLVSHTRLKSRVYGLERQLHELRQRPPAAAPAGQAAEAPDSPWHTTTASAPAQAQDSAAGPAAAARPPEPATAPPADAADIPPSPLAAAAPAPAPDTAGAPRAFVFRKDKAAALSAWLRENWVLAVAAASLAFAGIFMVQYGVEHGLLTPFWRVMGALGFGAALIAGGEWIRRRHGDSRGDGDGATAHLPSTLSGAGLIVLFAAVLSARVLYDLIAPGTALAGLCAVSVLAIVLGWFYGPVLAAVGIIGATAAPFLVGGESDAPWVFYYYFLLVAVAGLAVDTVRRWAWVSALVLIATLSAMWLLYLGLGETGTQHFLIAVLATALAAIAIPVRAVTPRHDGPSFSDMLAQKKGARRLPEFPTRLALGVIAFASFAAARVAVEAGTPEETWLALAALLVLLLATIVWMSRAPALADLALLPGAGFLFVLLVEPWQNGPLYAGFRSALRQPDPEVLPPDTSWIIYTLVALGAAVSVLAVWRMRDALRGARGDTAALIWAFAAAVFAPAVFLILEFTWAPAAVLGQYPWALVAIALAALMTLLAERCARGADSARRKLRIGLFAIAALTLIAMAFFLILTKSALTLALGVMVVLTALLDRRFDLPVLGWALQLGVAVISYRLIVDPGIDWAIAADSHLQVILAYAGGLALLAAAWAVLSRTPGRKNSQVISESAIWTIAAAAITVALFRLFDDVDFESHWGAGLLATVWLSAATAQLYRLGAPGLPLRWLRWLLAVVFGLVGFAMLTLQALVSNPLTARNELVLGPPVLDSLAVAFLPVAAVFAVAAWKLAGARPVVRRVLAALSALYAAAYVGLEIRRLWHGRDLSARGVTDPELYSYTLAMLLAAGLLLMLAFSRRSVGLRKLAMAGVALTIAKVFLIDMSGLSGLTRVFSFMGLGLALVALAWLNRKMTAQWEKPGGGAGPDREGPQTGQARQGEAAGERAGEDAGEDAAQTGAPDPGPDPEPDPDPDPDAQAPDQDDKPKS